MPIYLDHNATTAARPAVVEAMQAYLAGPYGNPSSVHRHGRAARDTIEAARERVAALVGARANEVVFTSGGTEADNLAVKGTAARCPDGRVYFGATEHPAVLEAAEALGEGRSEPIPVDADGGIDGDRLRKRLAESGPVALVAVMRANNETGRVQDLAPIVEAARAVGAPVLCDAVQAVGRLPGGLDELGADLLSVSAHKLGGPRGVGALVVRGGTDLPALIHGGGQERGLRSGTENLAGIVGFGVAADLAAQGRDEWQRHTGALIARLEAGLDALGTVTVFARGAPRLPNTCQFALPGYDGEALQMLLDRDGVSVSSGSACASGRGEPSHVLLAMGVEESLARSAVRVSVAESNTEADIDALLAALARLPGVASREAAG